MFDWGYCELIIWQTYSDRLREAEKNRLVRQARPGQKRLFRLPSWARAWLERWRSVPGLEWRAFLRGAGKEAAAGPSLTKVCKSGSPRHLLAFRISLSDA